MYSLANLKDLYNNLLQYMPNYTTNNTESNNDNDIETTGESLIFFDFETTGLNPYHEAIIEYCFINGPLQDNTNIADLEESANCISSLVNPNKKMEFKITEITGIYPEMLEENKDIRYHAPIISNFINLDNDSVKYLVAHNVDGFDKFFLNRCLKSIKDDSYKSFKYIDTILLAKKIHKNLKSYSLKSLTEYYNIKNGNHRAISDTIALNEVYKSLVKDLSKKKKVEYTYLLNKPSQIYNYIYN